MSKQYHAWPEEDCEAKDAKYHTLDTVYVKLLCANTVKVLHRYTVHWLKSQCQKKMHGELLVGGKMTLSKVCGSQHILNSMSPF